MAGKHQCRVCGGESFTTSQGLKVCDICGQQEEHYIELESQENIGEVDRSRLVTTTRFQEQETDEGPSVEQEVRLNNWTSYEAYNVILYEWTKGLLKLGASERVKKITFKLWVAYLQRINIAFVQKPRTPCKSSLKNTRDRKIIYEEVSSVDNISLHSYRTHGNKKKKKTPTKLDKIKDKIEQRKLKNAIKKKQDSSFMNTTLASELSKSLNELEVSMLSDSCASSSYGGDSKLNSSIKSDKSSREGSSRYGTMGSESETEGNETPRIKTRKKPIPRNQIVQNWMKRTAHIYSSDTEKKYSQDSEEEEEEYLEETNEGNDADSFSNLNINQKLTATRKRSSIPKKHNAKNSSKKVARNLYEEEQISDGSHESLNQEQKSMPKKNEKRTRRAKNSKSNDSRKEKNINIDEDSDESYESLHQEQETMPKKNGKKRSETPKSSNSQMEDTDFYEGDSEDSFESLSQDMKDIPKGTRKWNAKKYMKICEGVQNDYRHKLPFVMCIPNLLGILYLAVLLAREEDILLLDILRWCREGHIPYFSAPYLLTDEMELSYYDLFMVKDSKYLPDAKELQDISGRLAAFLSVQFVPLPSIPRIIKKFVNILDLPDQVAFLAESLVIPMDDKYALSIPPAESMAMAAIILTLKAYCGLDSRTEVMLSDAASAIKNDLPTNSTIIPFSWTDWQKHVSRLIWVCCQVDPPSAFHWQEMEDLRHFSPSIFSKYFWKEGMWRVPRSSLKKNPKFQKLTEDLLKHHGQSLEEVITQPPMFSASVQPLSSIIEQLSNFHTPSNIKDMDGFIKNAQELKKESYTNHIIDWYSEIGNLDSELKKSGSKIELLRTEENGKHGLKIQYQEMEEGKPKIKELDIPHPLSKYWMIETTRRVKWKILLPSLPTSFKWLVSVGSKICEAPEMEIIILIKMLQANMLRGSNCTKGQ